MSGVTKKIYNNKLLVIRREIDNELKTIIGVLPEKYNTDTIIKTLRKYYVYEWETFYNEFDYHKIKDKSINKFKGKNRYNMLKPELLLTQSKLFQKIISDEFVIEHFNQFNEDIRKKNEDILISQRNPKILKVQGKIEKSKAKTQLVTPDFIDKLIGLYERKTTTQKDKMYILKELKKYYNRKVINFFFKINDIEINRQLRNEAFYHLQSFNFNPRMRRQKFINVHCSNKKRKQEIRKVYAFETCNIPECPEELEYLLDNSKFENVKEYDFFISHSSKDSKKVQEIIKILNSKNFYVYCDWINDSDYLKRHLVCEATKNVIEKQLEKSRKLLFVDSENSRQSIWCKYELNFFRELNKEIFVVDINMIDDNLSEIHPYIDEWYYDIDYQNIELFKGIT